VTAADPTHTPSAGLTAGPGVAAGVLLAGGESRRMGCDKRTLRLGGASLVERNIAFLRSLFPTVAISVRDRSQLEAALGAAAIGSLPDDVEVLCDERPGSPLGGLATVLARFRAPVFALAADIAFADPDAVATVVDAFRDADVALPVVGGHLEPLHAVYGPGCLPTIRALLDGGRHSILDLLPEVRVATVPFDSARPFFNVNTPQDWDEARRRAEAAEGFRYEDPHAGAGVDRAGRGAGQRPPAVLAVVGRSHSSTTQLFEQLIPELKGLGLRVGTVKQVADFDIDYPGKDSWRHGRTGAAAYAVGSPAKLAYVETVDDDVPLDELMARFFSGFDLVLCEGFRREAPRVIEVYHPETDHDELMVPADQALAAVTDADTAHGHRFGLDEAPALARFIVRRLGVAVRTVR
jgi:molybdopterin-guanine dinucleotide biosynthesis protein MobB